jgi:hypothetical protein
MLVLNGTKFMRFIINIFMKTNMTGKLLTHPQTQSSKRPENKNVLDSREAEEQLNKGDDVTHNKKETHRELRSKKK